VRTACDLKPTASSSTSSTTGLACSSTTISSDCASAASGAPWAGLGLPLQSSLHLAVVACCTVSQSGCRVQLQDQHSAHGSTASAGLACCCQHCCHTCRVATNKQVQPHIASVLELDASSRMWRWLLAAVVTAPVLQCSPLLLLLLRHTQRLPKAATWHLLHRVAGWHLPRQAAVLSPVVQAVNGSLCLCCRPAAAAAVLSPAVQAVSGFLRLCCQPAAAAAGLPQAAAAGRRCLLCCCCCRLSRSSASCSGCGQA
jgi:hypothetical protein